MAVIIGAGGHAKVVVATARDMGIAIDGIYDDDPEKKGKDILGIRVSGALCEIENSGSLKAVLAVGDNMIRKRVAGRLNNFEWITLIHPDAFVHPSVAIGRGTVIFAHAVIQPDTILGDHCIINTGATVDHDCSISDFCHIAPGVNLAGGVSVKEGAFIGIGSSVIVGKSIGEWATVGAGGIVTTDIPAFSIAVGVPARTVKRKEKGEL